MLVTLWFISLIFMTFMEVSMSGDYHLPFSYGLLNQYTQKKKSFMKVSDLNMINQIVHLGIISMSHL